jgi:septal ring factor EnvC (AmiA/AmiB activator)
MMRRSGLKAAAARVHACWCAERAAGADRSAHRSRRLKQETQNLEAQKQAIIAQANAQKALLAKEIKSLRAEVEKVPGGGAGRE